MRIVLAAFLLVLQSSGILHQFGSVTGLLKNRQGIPVSGTRVVLTPIDGNDVGTLEGLAQTDKLGRFRIDNVPAGRYRLAIGPVDKLTYHPGVEDPRRATVIRVTDGTVTSVPDMLLSLSLVTGRVVDSKTGAGRSIESFTFSSGLELFKPAMHRDGSFSLLIPPGTYVVIGSDPAVVSFSQFLTVPDGPMDKLKFEASTLPEVRGHASVEGSVLLRADPANSYADGNMAAHQKKTILDSNGDFRIPSVIPGKYRLEITTSDGQTITREIVVGQDDMDVRL